MGVAELSALVSDSMEEIAEDKQKYMDLLKFNYSMGSLNVINRILVMNQAGKVTDIRTDDEWAMEGRVISRRAKPIKLLLPIYTYDYISTKSGEKMDASEFNGKERVRAVEMGIMKKVRKIDRLYVEVVYDIRDTRDASNKIKKAIGESITYTRHKPILSIGNLLRLIQSITNFEIKRSDTNETKLDFETKKIYVYKADYDTLARESAKVLSEFCIQRDNSNLKETEMDMLKESLYYTLCTMFLTETKIELEDFESISKNDKYQNLIYIDTVINEVLGVMKFNIKEVDIDICDRIERFKKAEDLYNIIDALSISHMLGIE